MLTPTNFPVTDFSKSGQVPDPTPLLISIKHPCLKAGSELESDGQRYRLVALSGHVHTSGEMYFVTPPDADSHRQSLNYEQALTACGAFLAVYKDEEDGSYIVLNDFHGFQHVFWSDAIPGQVVISDSFIALAHHLRAAGIPTELAPGVLYAQYASFNALLNHHNFNAQTLHMSIRLLRPDQLLCVHKDEVQIRSRPRFQDMAGRDYETLIHDGIERGAAMFKSALSWGTEDQVIYLSGGRDSRNVLALAIAAGVHTQIPVFAKQPPTDTSAFAMKLELDRAIAGQIITEFGISVWEDPYCFEVKPPVDPIGWWLTSWAGISHDYRLPKVASLLPSLRFIGAMGENYRTKVPDYVDALGLDLAHTPESFTDDFEKYFSRICPQLPRTSPQGFRSAKELFRESLAILGEGTAFWEGLDAYSELFRMPAHFSHTVSDRAINIWNINILGIPEFSYAAHLLDRKSRASGKVWKDINDAVDHCLNEIPFEFDAQRNDAINTAVADSWAPNDLKIQANMQKNTASAGRSEMPSPRINLRERSLDILSQQKDTLTEVLGGPRYDYLKRQTAAGAIHIPRIAGKLELLNELISPSTQAKVVVINL